MLSYLHDYHAGNFADVFKHTTLVYLINYLLKKETGIYYLDTHAGHGIYDVNSPHMKKNAEFKSGIMRLLESQTKNTSIQNYLTQVRLFNSNDFKRYPGSPAIAASLLRTQDRIHFVEKHPTVSRYLKEHVKKTKKTKIFKDDYENVILSVVPPIEKRGLIFIDPSYEVKEEFKTIPNIIDKAYAKFQTGIYAIWYPVKDYKNVNQFVKCFSNQRYKSVLRLEYCFDKSHDSELMNGTGMIIINPPFTLEQDSKQYMNVLSNVLGFPGGRWIVDCLN